MPVIDATGLEKSYGARAVLSGCDLTIRRGERVGLVGRNGSGKSTLGRILAGIETSDAGDIARRRASSVEFLAQEPELPEAQSIRQFVLESLAEWNRAKQHYDALTDALASGDPSQVDKPTLDAVADAQAHAGEALERLGGWERMHEAEAVLSNLGLTDPSRLISTLSGGERRRVALARVLVGRPSLAILDEPTNHLDVATIEWLEEMLLNRFEGALLLITHDRYVLDRVVTRTLDLEDGTLTSYDGGYAVYLEARAERQALAERSERNRQNFLRKELEWLRRQPKARAGKQKARIGRAEEAIAKNAPRAEKQAQLALSAERQGKMILELDKLSVDRGGERLIDALELRLSPGQRVGVIGANGTGKTSLLLALLGELAPSSGEIRQGTNTRLGYLDQQRSGLDPNQTVYDSLGNRSDVEAGGQRVGLASYLERFLFSRAAQRVKVGQLSGGERARVCLAKLLAEPINLLLLDEPTNDLDVSTLAALEEMLIEYSGSALVVSHDRWFLDRVATSILAFEGDGRIELHSGNYSEYRERTQARGASEAAAKASARSADRSTKQEISSGGAKLNFNERRELEGLLDAIDESETAASSLEAELADPETYQSGGDKLAALNEALEKARARVDELTERWETLEARREGHG